MPLGFVCAAACARHDVDWSDDGGGAFAASDSANAGCRATARE